MSQDVFHRDRLLTMLAEGWPVVGDAVGVLYKTTVNQDHHCYRLQGNCFDSALMQQGWGQGVARQWSR